MTPAVLHPDGAAIRALTPAACLRLATRAALRAMRLRGPERDRLFALAGRLLAQSQVAAARLSHRGETLQ